MTAQPLSILQRLYFAGFLAVLAILPMSHTTALRNVLLVALLALLVVHAYQQRRTIPDLLRTARPIPWALLAWCVFLLLFPLWAVYPQEAWANLRGQWGQSILAWIIGFGAVWVLGRRGPGLWSLALASALPVLIHIVTVLAGWTGLLGPDLPVFLSFNEAWNRLLSNAGAPVIQSFPLGFWGIEPMHGNIGYAACQAVALFCVLSFFSWRAGQWQRLFWSGLMIGLCLASTLAASSRGAFLYAVLVVLLAVVFYYTKLRNAGNSFQAHVQYRLRMLPVVGVSIGFGLVAFFAAAAMSNDIRWQTIADKVRLGLAQPEPAKILCEGLSPQTEQQIREDFGGHGEAYAQNLIGGLNGQDGGRILLMRAGVDLVLEHPRGIDGGRSTYMGLMAEKCGHQPKLGFAHLHQSWMDLALALGWAGALLFAWVLLYFFWFGWRALGSTEMASWALALALISAFWLLRGFADSLYREHYLQMQAFLIAYLWGFARPCRAAHERPLLN